MRAFTEFQEKGDPANRLDTGSSHMLDLSEESKEDNIATCVKYFKRMAKIDLWLEMEIGITGGEEDGVDNTGSFRGSFPRLPLLTALACRRRQRVSLHAARGHPRDPQRSLRHLPRVLHRRRLRKRSRFASPLSSPSHRLTSASAGVYKPGNVKLQPELLAKHQKYCHEQLKSENPLPMSVPSSSRLESWLIVMDTATSSSTEDPDPPRRRSRPPSPTAASR